jgi:hydroxymethylglutaryl-CoA synthase
MNSYGISALGLAFPSTAITLQELARLRGTDANKYRIGLGCEEMAICADGTTVVDLAVKAARRALARWHGNIKDIGLLVVGTESGIDFSRPLSAWVAKELDIQGAVRSYEVKHACLGGTLALRQAIDWKYAPGSANKAALVIAADAALYAPASAGEPTQGAGAVAMIVDTPEVAEIAPQSYAWSLPAYDFWRPVNEEYPRVDGPLSLKCYIDAARACFAEMLDSAKPEQFIASYQALCFHVPFPKITLKAMKDLGQGWGWNAQKIHETFTEKVEPYFYYNRLTGNSYTASLWVSVAHALAQLKKDEQLLAFSYGSGCGAELLKIRKNTHENVWLADLQAIEKERRYLTAEQYDAYRKGYYQQYLAPAA